jgi:hypothetical protein
VLKGLPHFLFWYQIDEQGNAVGNRTPFLISSIYNDICAGRKDVFIYGDAVIEKFGQKHFYTNQVMYFKNTMSDINDELFIEFESPNEYISWKKAVMFLMKTGN